MSAFVAIVQALATIIILGYRYFKKSAWLPALGAIALIMVFPVALDTGLELLYPER